MKNFALILPLLFFNFIYCDYNLECNNIKAPDIQATFKELGCYSKFTCLITYKFCRSLILFYFVKLIVLIQKNSIFRDISNLLGLKHKEYVKYIRWNWLDSRQLMK